MSLIKYLHVLRIPYYLSHHVFKQFWAPGGIPQPVGSPTLGYPYAGPSPYYPGPLAPAPAMSQGSPEPQSTSSVTLSSHSSVQQSHEQPVVWIIFLNLFQNFCTCIVNWHCYAKCALFIDLKISYDACRHDLCFIFDIDSLPSKWSCWFHAIAMISFTLCSFFVQNFLQSYIFVYTLRIRKSRNEGPKNSFSKMAYDTRLNRNCAMIG